MRRLPSLLVIASLAASAGMAAAQPAGLLRAAINSDIRSSEPGVNRDGNTDAVMMHVLEGLVALRENGDVGPLVAEKVDISADGKTYTFTLRDGLTFHNGAPVTSAEVAWAWKRYLDPATKWRCQRDFSGNGIASVEKIDTPDARTVVFTLVKPTALFLSVMARPDCGTSVIHPDSVGADGKWKAPIATGPFKLGEWKRGEYIELVRFDGYKPRPGGIDGYTGNKTVMVERARFIVIPDASAAKAALLADSIDILPDVTADDMAELKKRDIAIDTSPTMSMNAILIQTKDPLFQDVRMRRAMAMALDTKDIVHGITQGTAKSNASGIPTPSSYYSRAQQATIPYDPTQAKKLLAEAGYRGQPIKMLANKRYQSMYDQAVLAQAMLQQVGMNVEIEVIEWGAQLDRYIKGDYQVMSFSYSARLDPSLSYEMFSGPKATQPRKVWDDPEAQKLIQESMVTVDRVRRQAIFDELHRRMLDAVPIIVLYNGVEIAGVGKRVKGYKTWAAGQPRLWGVSLQ
ncbi:MAG: ABC transporter substrate-binding protein [Alphaproteobacteria bacterium]